MKTVPEMLKEAANTYEQRNLVYGDNYKNFGSSMVTLLPGPVVLSTEDDFNRFAVLIHIVTKVSRYCENFNRGGHDDSLLDVAVYATMLRELDQHATMLRELDKIADQAMDHQSMDQVVDQTVASSDQLVLPFSD